MEIIQYIVEFIFSIALFINALLFLPQIFKILRERSAKGVSLVTFLGLLLIQFAIVLHGLIIHDVVLIVGYIFSMITTGAVVVLIFMYRNHKLPNTNNEITLEEVLEQLPGHVYWKNKEGDLLGCNTNNWKDFGLNSLSEFIGKKDHDIFSKEEADRIRSVDDEVVRTDRPTVVEELLTVDGKTSLYLSHKVPLKNANNTVIGIAGVSVDVTNAKQETESQLDFLDQVISVMPGNVYWMNKDGVYLGCNDNQARLIGFDSRKEIVGKRNTEIRGFLIPEALDPVNKQVMEMGKTIVTEEPAVLPDGSDITVLSSKVPIKDKSGTVVGMVGISIDITDRKKSEQELMEAKEKAESANIAKTEFLNNMRHDLRTPFSGILSIAEVLEDKEDDASKKEMLGCITLAAKQLLDHLNEIFEFTKTEGGELPILDKQFDVHKLILDVSNVLTPSAKSKSLSLIHQIDTAVPQYVIGDFIRTQRVLLNLLSNAIKFTQKGSIELSLSLVSSSEHVVSLKFKVKDTGVGIPEDKQDLIFERFNRLTSSYSGVYGGKGLGLRIVKRFLDEIEGEIHLKSELGQGSTFIVLIPYKLPLSGCDEGEL